MTAPPRCRGCHASLRDVFVDLGVQPLANSYVRVEDARSMEPFYPLKVLVCRSCLLVQLEELARAEGIFSDYAYFSSASSSWVAHARHFAEMAVSRFGLDASSKVIELASNDGYLLQWFAAAGVPVLGVEPASNVAAVAVERGIPSVVAFFGTTVGEQLALDGPADLIVANNVLAHVPDLHDFVGGIAALLAPTGWVSIEVPHLLRLIEHVQYDTIYHEHFSYFSLHALQPVLAAHGLAAVDVEELPTHGGSLRLFVAHEAAAGARHTGAVARLLDAEREAGLDRLEAYLGFDERVAAAKRDLLRMLLALRDEGLTIAAYGAPAKGNTLLNWCGIGTDLVAFTCDRSPEKRGRLLPGSRIPIHAPEALAEAKPDIVWLLPWNLRDELVEQLAFVREWGGRFLVAQPRPEVME